MDAKNGGTPISLNDVHSLKVVELRQELDKRGLEKSGLKADLVKRLEKSILDESIEVNYTADDNDDQTSIANGNEDNDKTSVEENSLKQNKIVGEPDEKEKLDHLDEKSCGDDEQKDVEEMKRKDVCSKGWEEADNENTEKKLESAILQKDLEKDDTKSETAIKDLGYNEDQKAKDKAGFPEVDQDEIEKTGLIQNMLEEPLEESDHEDNTLEKSEEDKGMDADEVSVNSEQALEDCNNLPEDDRMGEDVDRDDTEEDQEEDDDQEEEDQEEEIESDTEADNGIEDQNSNQIIVDVIVNHDETKFSDTNEEKEVVLEVEQDCVVQIEKSKDECKSQTEVDQIILQENEQGKSSTGEEIGNYKRDSDEISVEAKVDSFNSDSDDANKTETDENLQQDSLSEKANLTPNEAIRGNDKSPDNSISVSDKSSVVKTEMTTSKSVSKETKDNPNESVDVENISKKSTSGTPKSREEKKKDLSRCLWISGLASITKAVDLKNTFNQYGKVVGAKVVTSAKTPGAQCFGFVTMGTSEEALKCIEKLHKTKLHDKIIQVEKAKTDPTPAKKPLPDRLKGERKLISSSGKKPDDKSKSKLTSKRQKASSSRSYRARERDDSKRRQSQDESRRITKKDDKKEDSLSKPSSRPSSKVGSPSLKSKSPTAATKRDSSKSERVKSDKDLKASKSSKPAKDSKEISKEKIDDKKEKEGKPKSDVKSLDVLRKERADKIEREHRLREERRKKERERERQLREERRREQEKREKERKERARKEAERVRKEREKQRDLEKQREREREKERERFIRERKEREEKERREREQLERERLERERLERERRERERLETEKLERERQERERLEKERLAREERENRIQRERQYLERERLERERTERDRHRLIDRGIDRGFGNNVLKRPGADDRDRSYHPDMKRSLHESGSKKDFFTSPRNERPQFLRDDVYDSVYQRDMAGSKPDSRQDRESRRGDDHHGTRRGSRDYDPYAPVNDIRRVVSRKESPAVDRFARERSPHRVSERYSIRARELSPPREGDGRDDRSWLSAPSSNAPKTLSDVLGRAGLTGILGNQAQTSKSVTLQYSKDTQDNRFFSTTDRPLENDRRYAQSLEREVRIHSGGHEDHYRDTHGSDRVKDGRTEVIRSYPEDRRVEREDRYRESGADRSERRDSSRSGDRRESSRSERRDGRTDELKDSRFDERKGVRSEEKRDRRSSERRRARPDDRNCVDNRRELDSRDHSVGRRDSQPNRDYRSEIPISTYPVAPNARPVSITERRGLHPLASEIASRPIQTVMPPVPGSVPRVIPLDLLSRQPPVVSNTGLPVSYASARPITIHQLAATGVQFRDGRLEYTSIAAPQTGIPQIRRF